MTPMIDVVFQLMIFFMLTFNIIAPEGDFDVRMCKGLDECSFMPSELRRLVKGAVKDFESNGNTKSFRDTLRKQK